MFGGVLKPPLDHAGFFHHNDFQESSRIYRHFIRQMFKAFILHQQKTGLKTSEKIVCGYV